MDTSHPNAGCGGTPDEYDSKKDKFKHFAFDRGGVLRAGGPAFVASMGRHISSLFGKLTRPMWCISQCGLSPAREQCMASCMTARTSL